MGEIDWELVFNRMARPPFQMHPNQVLDLTFPQLNSILKDPEKLRPPEFSSVKQMNAYELKLDEEKDQWVNWIIENL